MNVDINSYERYLNGDDSAFADIVREYADGLMLYINSFTRNIHIAEDLTEEVFFKLAVKKPHFRKQSSFKTWLYSIGRNTALDYLRKESRYAKTSIEEHKDTQMEEESIELLYLKEEQKVKLHTCLKSLKPEYAQVLYLVFFEEFDNAQTAQIMKKTKRQTENLIYRAKAALKSKLEKEGFEYENI